MSINHICPHGKANQFIEVHPRNFVYNLEMHFNFTVKKTTFY